MAAQPIKYFSTDVTAARSASQLLDILIKYRAQRTTIEWDDKAQPVGVEFIIADPKHGQIPVRLTARIDDVIAAVKKKKGVTISRERAAMIAWRHLKDLVEQQLLSVDLGLYTLTEAFFASVLLGKEAEVATLGEWVSAALESGEVPRDRDQRLRLPPPRKRD